MNFARMLYTSVSVGIIGGFVLSFFKKDEKEYFKPGYRFKYLTFPEYSLTQEELNHFSDNLEEYDLFAKNYDSELTVVHPKGGNDAAEVTCASDKLICVNALQLLPSSAWKNLISTSQDPNMSIAHMMYGDVEVNKAIILHEIGHIKLEHLQQRKNYVKGVAVATLIGCGLEFSKVITRFSNIPVLGNYYHRIMIYFGLVYIVFHLIARQHEYEADVYATKKGYGNRLIHYLQSSDKTVQKMLKSSPFFNIRYIFDVHPSNIRRIEHIRKVMEK